MNDVLQTALDCLKANGYKLTAKRKQLLTYLIDEKRYISAKDCYDYMEAYFPGISFDTIYRNLYDFVQLQMVDCSEWDGEKHYRYHCCQGHLHHHHHFICTSCGRVIELESCPLAEFQAALPGCQIEDHQIELYGKCSNCVKNKEES